MPSITQQEKEKQPFHVYKDIRIQTIPVSPASVETPLQMICFFDRTKNMTMEGGSADVDKRFSGTIKKIRTDYFRGELFETMIVNPLNKQIPAKKLLLVGFGDPDLLSIERLQSVGRMIVNEAIKLEVSSVSFAPDIKDAGVEHLSGIDISTALVRGVKESIDSAQVLEKEGMISPIRLSEIVFLAGAAHLKTSQASIEEILDSAEKY
ncbi:MAG: M17 family peptidase N-terminal domain-containing protein [Phormidesmis sp.]